MRRSLVPLLLLALDYGGLGRPRADAPARAGYSRQASVSVVLTPLPAPLRGYEHRTTEVSFEVARLWGDEGPRPIVIEETIESMTSDNAEGTRGRLRAEARAAPFDAVAWTLEEEANEGAFDGEALYLTALWGCCDSIEAYRAYDVKTGRRLLSYTPHGESPGPYAQPLSVEVPNSPELSRYIGVLSREATRDFERAPAADGTPLLALVTYAGLAGPLHQLAVYGPDSAGWGVFSQVSLLAAPGFPRNESRGQRVRLWHSDGGSDPVSALEGFALQLTVADEGAPVIRIPFAGDRPDLANATVPAGFRVIPAR